MNSTQAKGLYIAKGVAYDPKYRRYFITDSGNQRVLWWNSSSALTTGRPADGVLGQLNFTDKFGGVARNKLWVPMGLAVDASGNLWVADEMNNRVVRYPGASLASGMDADLVLGQADFTSRLANRGGPASANTMSAPQSIGVGKNGDVWVAERDNHRVLGFSATGLANGVNADFVLGQADFSGSSSNRGGSINADTLSAPTGVYVDNNNRVWVADLSNRRVLRFDSPSINKDAALVLGQNDFISNTGGGGQNKLTWPAAVILDYFANVWVADRDGNRIISIYSGHLTIS